ncbi:hypothetical protein CNMCM5793_004057 [Aspergillus hiratsukae]|uniref:Uncharacterized protein n=1 Tax=Aspergillus hiratsukae TaxID=1194566 RepID=A0A8H6PEK5_9EURO|nr:hypothetical protein CNMCM5793_004057 [Aspergillus hiratsukae]
MASFFCEVRHLNHQYDNEQDTNNSLQWLFSNNDEEQPLLHEEQNNAIDMGCPGCIRREERNLVLTAGA